MRVPQWVCDLLFPCSRWRGTRQLTEHERIALYEYRRGTETEELLALKAQGIQIKQQILDTIKLIESKLQQQRDRRTGFTN